MAETSTIFGFMKYVSATDILSDFKKTVDSYFVNSLRYLSMKGYRIAIIPKTKYILVFDIREDTVFVLGIFHQLENYWIKV